MAKIGASVYYLKDHYGHKLLHSVPASHLVHFYEKGIYKSDGITSAINPTSSDVESDEPGNTPETCQRVHSRNSQQKTSTPKKDRGSIPSQIIIISSKELPLSSDESSTKDVSTEADVPPSPTNPWGDININNIPIQIVNHLRDMEDEMIITDVTKKPSVYFKPLTGDDRKVAAMKFNLVITGKSHPVEYKGVGKLCSSPPVITQLAKGNGAFPCS